jgi:hypothetical protein
MMALDNLTTLKKRLTTPVIENMEQGKLVAIFGKFHPDKHNKTCDDSQM